MNVVLFGANGMVGGGVLRACLGDPRVDSVLAVGRHSCGVVHPKLRERLLSDLLELDAVKDDLTGYEACFFCVGVSSLAMSETEYRRVTLDLTVGIAAVLGVRNPGLTFCYVSAQGSDMSGRSRVMWARIRGETENRLLQMPFRAYTFRPGLTEPWEGVPSRTKGVRLLYALLHPFFPVLKRLFPNQVTTTAKIGRAMIRAATVGCSKHVLEVRDINALAEAAV
jgi:uncharacterized protein YbjT (DUF2867 family)